MSIDAVDLTSLDQFEAGFPHETFAELRREAPVWWHRPTDNTPDGEGFWVVSAYEPLMEGAHMFQYGADLIAERRRKPSGDLFSNVVHATIEEGGSHQRLSDEELHGFFNLLFAAGSETTRNAIAGGLLALMQHPDQMRDLRNDPTLMRSAVEEILRWTSPVLYNRRTATRDTEIAGAKISAGEKTTHWYPSANRDAAVFAAADTFDIRRQHNPHVAFGHGAHFCIGANLARREIAVLLEEALARLDDFELAGEVRYSRSNKHMGMQTMPIRFRRRQGCRGME